MMVSRRRSQRTVRSTLYAAALAPLTAPLVISGFAIVKALWHAGPIAGIRSGLLAGALVVAIGIPLSYFVALVVGAPLLVIVHALGIESLATVLLCGCACGVISARMLRPFLDGELLSLVISDTNAALLGLTTAGVFWIFRGRCSQRPANE